MRRSWIWRLMPRTLLGRTLAIMMIPLVLLQLISTWMFYDRHWDTVTRRLSESVSNDISAVVQLIQKHDDMFTEEELVEFARKRLWLHINFRPGSRLPEEVPEPGFSILDRKLHEALNQALDYPFAMNTSYAEDLVEIRVGLPEGVLRVLVSRKRLFSSTTYIFIMWMIGSSIILFGVATVFLRNQVRPIRRLAIAADRFGKGRDVPDFKPEGASEVRQASAAFIRMRQRIKRQMDQRTEMLAGVSHDLRTPLTRMKLELAMLGDTPEARSLADDVVEMERMVEGYLAFARGEGQEQPSDTDLDELVREVAESVRREGAKIDLHIEERIHLPLRREAMRRCLHNLVKNAQRYGGQNIAVTLGRRGQIAEITVDDDGPGIPEDRRNDVFKPFFRLESSRNPQTGGTGLGLTIARDVVRGHGGELSLEDAPGGGLRARVQIPI
jgi:two-component system osmolarity sensor histidine kinase EnvZ